MYVSLLCINFPARFIFIFISSYITDLFLHTTHVTLAFIISVACLVFAYLAYMHLTFFWIIHDFVHCNSATVYIVYTPVRLVITYHHSFTSAVVIVKMLLSCILSCCAILACVRMFFLHSQRWCQHSASANSVTDLMRSSNSVNLHMHAHEKRCRCQGWVYDLLLRPYPLSWYDGTFEVLSTDNERR
jgi:hypothetical protein